MQDINESFIHLRILILSLGEKPHLGWWNSQFLTSTGLSFLERLYPRSKFAAAVRSAGRAALRLHDERIGKGNVAHLFRLPLSTEQQINEQLAYRSDEFEALYLPMLNHKENLLQKLEILADDGKFELAVGPVQVSSLSTRLPSALSALYLFAFRDGTQVFPYFELELH